ncbi:EAL domain-containing protein [Corallincola holothuriorum]|uniref:EAL domain-containing protein n=1 Tax=Corallincola holothuriorum TaxID=2282215 RepID=A0A368NP96_9GAMM|nr:EAL domain-containing protein [Corallincola holothuriorum]RCU51713.1 EAL domain-containing protein [Corallincola holothuriorum]
MTLYRQVFLLLIVTMLLSLIAVMTLNLRSNASYLEQQLYANTDSTVTSLGMRLAPLLQPLDRVSAESTVNVAFDGTFLKRIDVEIFADESHITRVRDDIDEGVPEWFISLFSIPPVVTQAPLTLGWNEVALLTVEGHPGTVYKQLWTLMRELLMVYGLLFTLLALFTAVALRWLIRPLRQIEHQAHAIEQKDFEYRIPLPSTREFRRVVIVLNQLTALLKSRFLESARQLQEVRGKLLTDADSGLMTRQALLDAVTLRQEQSEQGVLVLIRVGNLDSIRKQEGFPKWRALLASIHELLISHFSNTAGESSLLVGRLSSEEFALLLDSDALSYPQEQLQGVCDDLNSLAVVDSHLKLDCQAAGLLFNEQSLPQLLTRLDEQLRGTAGLVQRASWIESDAPLEVLRTAEQWLALLRSQLSQQALALRWQPVVGRSGETLQKEVFTSVKDEQGQSLHAGLFVPVIEQFELGGELDLAVVQSVLMSPEKSVPTAINLSLSAMRDTRFIGALSKFGADVKETVLFELSELNLLREQETVVSFAAVLRQLGYRFGVDQLGASGLNLDYLQGLRPDYVKLAPALCRDDDEYGELLTAVVNTVSSLGIPIYATAVETLEQAERLWGRNIAGVQGYLTDK